MNGNELTDRQLAFCVEYIKDYNGTQAVIRAGYSKKGAGVTANRLLKNPKIRQAIRETFETNIMSASEIKSILTDIARGKVADSDVNNRINALKELGKIFQLTTTTRIDDWRTDAIEAIKSGSISYEDMLGAVRAMNEPESLADELFRLANVPIDSSPS